jgi:hypothetical protein
VCCDIPGGLKPRLLDADGYSSDQVHRPSAMADAPSPDELKQLFALFDPAGNGAMDVEGLRGVMLQL